MKTVKKGRTTINYCGKNSEKNYSNAKAKEAEELKPKIDKKTSREGLDNGR